MSFKHVKCFSSGYTRFVCWSKTYINGEKMRYANCKDKLKKILLRCLKTAQEDFDFTLIFEPNELQTRLFLLSGKSL